MEQCAAHASKLHIQLDLVQEHNGAKIYLDFDFNTLFFVTYFLKIEISFEVNKSSKIARNYYEEPMILSLISIFLIGIYY